ncbi:MAG: zinc ribbon domain-containing protein, partial [Nocardioidaceae bacterium]
MTVDGSRPRLSTNPFCAWCGAGQIENARFCPGCGRSVAAASSVADRPPHEWLHDEVLQDEQPRDEELWDEEPTTLLESLGGRRDEAASSKRPRSGRGPRPVRPSRSERPASLRGASRRWVMIAAVGVVVLLLVSAAGTLGFRYFQDRPVRDAFDTAQRSYAPLVAAMAGVSDMDEVAAVGERFAEVNGSLKAQLREVAARDTRLAGAVEAVLTAQVAVADAGAHLAELDGDDLDGWGPAHQSLRDAFGNVESATKALSSVDTDAAAEVADGDDALTGLESVVGAEVAESAEATLVDLVEQLDEAKVTEDVRATASE